MQFGIVIALVESYVTATWLGASWHSAEAPVGLAICADACASQTLEGVSVLLVLVIASSRLFHPSPELYASKKASSTALPNISRGPMYDYRPGWSPHAG